MKLGFRLLCVTDRTATRDRSLLEVIQELIEAGLRGLQIREKDLPDAQFGILLRQIQNISDQMPVRLFVNSRMEHARNTGAGLHLPEGSDIPAARKTLGPDWVIGSSCHSIESALAAEKNGASFVMPGPVFQTLSKHTSNIPLGLDALSNISRAVRIPVVAVGGITPQNAAICLQAGAAAVASVGSLLSSPNAQSALVDFMRSLGRL